MVVFQEEVILVKDDFNNVLGKIVPLMNTKVAFIPSALSPMHFFTDIETAKAWVINHVSKES